MNRQIYGFTLFVFIVKSAFLIYWVFLAPVSFVKILKVDLEPTKNFNRPESVDELQTDETRGFLVAFQNAVIDLGQQKFSADLIIEKLRDDQLEFPLNARLKIFDEDFQLVWQGDSQIEVDNCYIGGNAWVQSALIDKTVPEFTALDKNRNYFVQVSISPENAVSSKAVIYQPSPLQPVLLSHAK